MQKTSIEWVRNPDGSQGYTFNPITGCLNNCSYCYAEKLANTRLLVKYQNNLNVAADKQNLPEFEKAIDDPFYPRFWEDRLWQFHKGDYDKAYPGRTAYFASIEKEKGIFVCDMSDLFGIGVPEEWTRKVMSRIKDLSQHRFYLLTKQPQNLIKFKIPDNCWVGVSATNTQQYIDANNYLSEIESKVKYLSIEPLLEKISCFLLPPLLHSKVSWVIVGACTGTRKDMEELIERRPGLTLMPFGKKWTLQPRIEWIQKITEACDKAGIPVFHKNSLKPIFPVPTNTLRQEMPNA